MMQRILGVVARRRTDIQPTERQQPGEVFSRWRCDVTIPRPPASFAPAIFVLLSVAVQSCSRTTRGEDWPQFRGPDSNGVVTGVTLRSNWDGDADGVMKIELPGVGWSQPIAWGNNIYLTTAETENQKKPEGGQAGPGFRFLSLEGFSRSVFNSGTIPDKTFQWKVLCLDGVTGKVLWERIVREGRPTIPIHRSNSYASETPVTDGQCLVAYFGMTGIYCLDMSGNVLWSKELGTFPTQFGWGTGSSPALHNDTIYVQCDNEKASFLVALDRESGDELWRVERDERSNWSTPYIWKNDQRTELVTVGGRKIRSYDPITGDELWEMNASGRSATTPVCSDQLLYVGSVTRSTGSRGILAAIRAGAEGDISLQGNESSNDFVVWSLPNAAPPLASPLVYEDCLYALNQHGGIVRCLDAKTGKQHYRQRLPDAGSFTSSPWANNGMVFCLDEKGQTFVIKAGPELEIVGTNKIDDMFWSSAAIVGEDLLLRGTHYLYRISP